MILESSSVSRAMVYFFFDKDGYIDEYVLFQLKALKSSVENILFVSNGLLQLESKEKIIPIVSDILERSNTGFDVWAYKEGMEIFSWDRIVKYDELVLMNFTMYGPLYSFSEMFLDMDNRDIDFWGITKHHGFPFDPFGTIPMGYIPEHIQSSFICIRNKMLRSKEFQEYWDNMDMVNSYGEAVGKHEAIFTLTFESYGYKSDVYVRTDDLKHLTHYPLMIEPLELIKNRKCPVFKRKSFTNEYYEFLNCSLGEPTVEMYDYIKNNLDYDLNMVWDNLLRTEHMADIKNRMHLNFVLPVEHLINPDIDLCCKTALMLHIYFLEEIETCLFYARSMPPSSDVYITTDTLEKKQEIEKQFAQLQCNFLKVILVENRGRDVGALLVGLRPYIKDYQLVCFAHDKKTVQFEPHTIGKSFSYKCFENVLGTRYFVKNIIETFVQNPRLGMLMPPPPNHAAFYGVLGTEWGSNFEITKNLATNLGVNVPMDIMKEPISPLGTMFWFRPDALNLLLQKEWKYSDFPQEPNGYDGTLLHAVERIYGFTVQAAGYYPAWCMHDKFAAIELTNYHFMLRELTMTNYSIVGHQAGFNIMCHQLRTKSSLRPIIKEKLRKLFPQKIWFICARIYKLFGGSKWLS